MSGFEEQESDVPEWEIAEEKIPESLQEKWQREEREGLRAGVCAACGWPFTKMDLPCRHCGRPTDLSTGAVSSLRRWFLKSWPGLALLAAIGLSLILLLLVV